MRSNVRKYSERQTQEYRFKTFVINKRWDMAILLRKAGVDIELQGACYCPFHPDEGHKSAKLFRNDDGTSYIYCFAEHRRYEAADVITKVLLEPIDKYYERAWMRLSGTQQEEYRQLFNLPVERASPEFTQNKERLKNAFMKGESSYMQTVKEIIVTLLNEEKKE
jgi:hypothetical protein